MDIGRKIPLCFCYGEGKVTVLKYTRAFCSLQTCTQEKLFYPGNSEKGTYSTLAPSSYPALPKEGDKTLRTTDEVHSSGDRLAKRLDLIIEPEHGSAASAFLKAYLLQFFLTSTSFLPFKKTLQGILKDKKHSLKRLNSIRIRVRYARKVGIIRLII